jgi:hypothetical protein
MRIRFWNVTIQRVGGRGAQAAADRHGGRVISLG